MIQPSLVMSCLTELLGVWTAFILQSGPCQIVEHPWGEVVSSDVCLNDDSCGVMQRDCRTLMAFSAPEA